LRARRVAEQGGTRDEGWQGYRGYRHGRRLLGRPWGRTLAACEMGPLAAPAQVGPCRQATRVRRRLRSMRPLRGAAPARGWASSGAGRRRAVLPRLLAAAGSTPAIAGLAVSSR
jgi:hypothetical protein